jgi:hypothetical protein
MLNMQKFHRSLCASENRDSYLEALRALVKANSAQLRTMSSSLDWQAW